MRIMLATLFLIVGTALVTRDSTLIVGALLLAWVPHLIVEHVVSVELWRPRHPRTIDELLELDEPTGEQRTDDTRDN
jgi:hypothetical protein